MIKAPKRFMSRLKTLVARQAKVRDDLRALVSEAEEYLTDNEEAAHDLESAVDALSRLA